MGGILNANLGEKLKNLRLDSKDAFAQSISQVFLISTFIMGIAFVASFFLKEIPLRKTHAKGLEEARKELAAEDAIIPNRNEPDLF